jgi:glycosyltransferase involved in cell wall biosynthesis
MKPSPLVSVIIPTYNRSATLAEAIDSVLGQDYPHFELIVVDDGSTDDTPAILCRSSTDSRVIVLTQENAGVSAARNSGIAIAKGEFVAFLDSDDLWLPKKLSIQVEWFRKNPGAMICQSEERWIRNSRRVNPGVRHKKISGDIFIPSLSLCLVSPSAVMLKYSLLDEIGWFDPGLPACEDYDLWLRVACRHPVGLIDTPLAVRRGGHADQLSAMPGLDKYRIHAILKVLGDDCLSKPQREAAIQVLRDKCTIFANGCEKRGRHEEAAYYRRCQALWQ